MRRVLWALALLCLALPALPAQNPSGTEAPYLLPQTIFVGDLGRLVVPLGREERASFVLESPEELPKSSELVIRRIEMERRAGTSRLLIDFVPYAAGSLDLPELDFLPLNEAHKEELSGLKLNVASILAPSQMALSEPASPLAVPGTSVLIYGSIAILLLLLLLGIGGSLWSHRHFREFWEKLRRRFLLRGMLKFLRRVKQECRPEKNADPVRYLSLLSAQFREFLSLFTGINCRSLSAGEFLHLNLRYTSLEGPELCRLFRHWDTLRFSGRGMEMADLFLTLDEIDRLIALLDRAEKDNFLAKPLPLVPAPAKSAAGEIS